MGLEGIAEALLAVLDIADHEDFVACFWVGSAFLQTAAIAFLPFIMTRIWWMSRTFSLSLDLYVLSM